METRMKYIVVEEQTKANERNRDIKGKAIAKEEVSAKIFEIADDSEDEEPCQGGNRKYKAKGKSIGGSDNAQTDEDQPTLPAEWVRRYGRGRGGRGTGSRKDAGGRRGRGRSRSEEGRGMEMEQEMGPGKKKARRSIEKRIRQAERAYHHNTNLKVR